MKTNILIVFIFFFVSTNLFGQTIPAAPKLLFPQDSAYFVLIIEVPQFFWHTTSNVNSYRFTIATDTLFKDVIVSSGKILDTSFYYVVPMSPGKYYWKVDAFGDNGNISNSEIRYFNVFPLVSVDENNLAKEFSLSNYPNPFSSNTTIKYKLPKEGFASIKVFDLLGREIKTIASEFIESGNHNITFDANNIPAGNYILQLKTSDGFISKEIQIVK